MPSIFSRASAPSVSTTDWGRYSLPNRKNNYLATDQRSGGGGTHKKINWTNRETHPQFVLFSSFSRSTQNQPTRKLREKLSNCCFCKNLVVLPKLCTITVGRDSSFRCVWIIPTVKMHTRESPTEHTWERRERAELAAAWEQLVGALKESSLFSLFLQRGSPRGHFSILRLLTRRRRHHQTQTSRNILVDSFFFLN